MPAYGKSLYVSAEFGELHYSEVKTVAASTNICSSLWHCIKAGCGSSKPRDVAGPGGAHLGRITDKLLCLHTGFGSEHKRVVCAQTQMFILVMFESEVCGLWSLPKVDSLSLANTLLSAASYSFCCWNLVLGCLAMCKTETKEGVT